MKKRSFFNFRSPEVLGFRRKKMQIARPAPRELKSMNTFAFVKTQKVNLAAAFSNRQDKKVKGQEK